MKKYRVGVRTVIEVYDYVEAESRAEAKKQIAVLVETGKLHYSSEEDTEFTEEMK
jgi:hypothetical protein